MLRDELVDRLLSHRLLGGAPREELVWIATHATPRHFEQGESICRHTEVVTSLHVLLKGQMSIYVQRGPGVRKVMEWRGGDVWGILPYSRMITPPGDTFAEEPTEALTLRRDQLPDLIRNCYEVTAALVHHMTDRARVFTSTDLRDEKMRSLGKLAAGFAHEVNNPASAVLRDARSLEETLAAAAQAARELYAIQLTDVQCAALDTLNSLGAQARRFSGLELADREDAIAAWLAAQGMNDELAAELALLPITVADRDRLPGVFGHALAPALRWIAAGTAGRSLVANIERAAARIHALVQAAKGFTHMDRTPELTAVDLPQGLSETVILLEGKARAKSVRIELAVEDGLPSIRGFTAELNQVWMNLIDNAIDASPSPGVVSVRARLDGAAVVVTVQDGGPGIPPDIQQSIFDPFFTTKPVGEGTGLGLDIARRIVLWHEGEITVDSAPGHTEFRISLPLAGPG